MEHTDVSGVVGRTSHIMKVLHIISDLDSGGAEAVLIELVLSDHKNTHIVISMMDKGVVGQTLIDAGVTIVELGMAQGRLSVSGLLAMHQCIRSQKPDVIQTWMYHSDLTGGLVARLAGVKAICWGIHNSNLSAERTSWRSRLVAWTCARLSSWLPRQIISCSSYAAQVHKGIGYNTAKISVVYNGYDLSKFKPVNTSNAWLHTQSDTDPQHCFLFGMMARWHPVKDHDNLLNALSQLQGQAQWHLILFGEGMSPDNADLNERLTFHQLNDKVTLLGQRNDVPELLAALDLHILSSAGEAFPNAVAEAMACGTPCVVTDVGDAAFIVDGTGLVVPPSDSQALCNAIETMLTKLDDNIPDGAKYQQRLLLHEKIASRFSSKAMVDGYNTIWQKAAGRH